MRIGSIINCVGVVGTFCSPLLLPISLITFNSALVRSQQVCQTTTPSGPRIFWLYQSEEGGPNPEEVNQRLQQIGLSLNQCQPTSEMQQTDGGEVTVYYQTGQIPASKVPAVTKLYWELFQQYPDNIAIEGDARGS